MLFCVHLKFFRGISTGTLLVFESPLCPIPSTPVCVSLDEPEAVDSVLTFLSGYDTPKYFWVKATAVSVRLQILFVTL